jgi:WD40 repeat protein
VWDIQKNVRLVSLPGHKQGIGCVSFSPDGEYLVTCGFKYDKQLLFWDWKSKNENTENNVPVPLYKGKIGNKVHAVSFHESGDYFVTCGDRHLKFWNMEREVVVAASAGRGKGKAHDKDKEQPRVISLSGKPGSITEALKDTVFMDVICGSGPYNDTVYCTTSNGVLCAFHESRLMDKGLQVCYCMLFYIANLHAI